MKDLPKLMEAMRLEYAVGGPDRGEMVAILCMIRDVRAELAQFGREVEADLIAECGGDRRFVVEGYGEVGIKRKTKRTGWRHDELLPVLIARIMDEKETLYDPETGELLPYVQIGHNLTRRLRGCVSFGAGKVTGLRELNLSSDEFCNEEPDGYGVHLPERRRDG